MNNRKCPDCKECLDLYFPPNSGNRYYICWLCGKWYKLVTGNRLVEIEKEDAV